MDLKAILAANIGSLVRWVMTIFGTSGFMLSDDQTTQLSSALATIISIGWSIWKNYREHKLKQSLNAEIVRKEQPRTSIYGLLIALALGASLSLSACAATTATDTEYTADSAVFTVLTVEKAVLQFPCRKDTVGPCVDKALAGKLKASRLAVMAALYTYHDARDAYVAGGDGAALKASFAALQKALTEARALLATPEVQDIMNNNIGV